MKNFQKIFRKCKLSMNFTEGLDTLKISYEVSRSIGEQILRIIRILEDS